MFIYPSMCRGMKKVKVDEIRMLFTEIGGIMEDTSLVALVWGADGELNAQARYRAVTDAHAKISELLAQIEIII